MDFEHAPILPDAHQQIRLGDNQVSAQKWSTAIQYYRRAIDYFKAIQKTLDEKHLISILQAQIEQCEKTIHLCELKDRAEQAARAQQAERSSRMTRAHSTSSFRETHKPERPLTRNNTFRLENTVRLGGHGGMDSFAAFIFPKNENVQPVAKKHDKSDAEILEELRVSNNELKAHLRAVVDHAEQLRVENERLRNQRGPSASQPPSRTLVTRHEEENDEHVEEEDEEHHDEDEPETEIEATL